MKLINNLKIMGGALLVATTVLTSSCDFLDIVPVEQEGLIDATKDANATLGFLQSCYNGIVNPIRYTGAEASADEYALPPRWASDGYASHKYAYDLITPQSLPDNRWDRYYEYIGRTHLFLQELPKARGVTEADKIQWEAEAYFLLAYYHFEVLRFYGPCPINDRYYPESVTTEELPGRYHYDYVTDWIVKLLDEKVINTRALPDTRDTNTRGRATHVIALALKAKALLYAASPLWNGSFPFPEWKNTNFETPGYGKELVSKTYSREKWVRAEEACQAALDAAEAATDGGGALQAYRLYGTQPSDFEKYDDEKVPLPFIPGEVDEEFKKRVLMLRYMMSLRYNEGNAELVWGLSKDDDSFITAAMPNRVLQYKDGNWYNGWSGVAPYLSATERFYTKDGLLPKDDGNFPNSAEWLNRAGISGREDIIKLNVGREPRFYAWLAFDGGDYSSMLANGKPLQVDLKNGEAQGYNPKLYNRNQNSTGYFSQKYLRPNLVRNRETKGWNYKKVQRPLLRMAELYLNLAECEAMLDQKTDALEHLNRIRQRAGVRKLTEADEDKMPLIEWVRNERFIEFFAEGQRYHDVRRWAQGPQYLSAGKRTGLNSAEMVNPSFEIFNQRVTVNQPYRWSNRMYIIPIEYYEITSNPQLVQAPGHGY